MSDKEFITVGKNNRKPKKSTEGTLKQAQKQPQKEKQLQTQKQQPQIKHQKPIRPLSFIETQQLAKQQIPIEQRLLIEKQHIKKQQEKQKLKTQKQLEEQPKEQLSNENKQLEVKQQSDDTEEITGEIVNGIITYSRTVIKKCLPRETIEAATYSDATKLALSSHKFDFPCVIGYEFLMYERLQCSNDLLSGFSKKITESIIEYDGYNISAFDSEKFLDEMELGPACDIFYVSLGINPKTGKVLPGSSYDFSARDANKLWSFLLTLVNNVIELHVDKPNCEDY